MPRIASLTRSTWRAGLVLKVGRQNIRYLIFYYVQYCMCRDFHWVAKSGW